MTTQLRRLPGVRRQIASTVHRVLSDSGEPLGAGVGADLEPRFRADFSTVRIHADETASASAPLDHEPYRAFQAGLAARISW